MGIETRKVDDVNILDIEGKLTKQEAEEELRGVFRGLLDAGERRFLFNMREVPYMDSAAIGEVVACAKRAHAVDGSLKLVVAEGGKPDQVFRLTAIDRVLQIFSDEQQAVASFT